MNVRQVLPWLALFGFCLVGFAVLETYALLHPDDGVTLSRLVWEVSAAWPPFPFFAGFSVGFLACHFWWGGIVWFAPPKTRRSEDPNDHRG